MFVLAERLGMPVSELVERIDAAEIAEWMAHFRLQQEPGAFESSESVERRLRAAFSRRLH